MKAKTNQDLRKPLVCPECGYSDRFLEVMAEEVHIVNRYRDYVSVLEARTDHYVCSECGTAIYEEEAIAK